MSYLTEAQRDVLAFIRDRIDRDRLAPTLQEIADRFGFASTASAQKHVLLLTRKGFLERVKHQKRGLLVTDSGREALAPPSRLPLLGTVAAGSPIDVLPEEESLAVPADWHSGRGAFVLRVRGESMIEEGIHDGDLVVVRRGEEAAEGDMVVALVNGEVTLKRLFRQGAGTLRLQPSNAALSPLVVPADEVRVQGTVIGLMRRY